MMQMLRRWTCRVLVFCLSLFSIQPTAHALDFAEQVHTYVYQPWVFADRKLTVGIPADPEVLRSFLWYLRMDESVRSQYGMESLGQFVRQRRVPGVDFSGHRRLTNGDLERMLSSRGPGSQGTPFRLLKLSGTLTDDRALATVGRLYDLQVLTLSDHVGDKGVPFLKSLRRLHALTMPSASITDQSLETLALLTSLQRLSLPQSRITDAGLRRLQDLPLRQIDVGPAITDSGVEVLAAIPTLEEINLHSARVSEKGLRALQTLRRLHTLFLGPSIQDADVAAVASLKSLKRLDLSGARLTDKCLPVLAQMTQLEELALSDTQVSDQALQVLQNLPRLRYLELSGVPLKPGVFKGLKGFSALQVFSFTSDRRLSIQEVKGLARWPRLHTILINKVPLNRAVVEHLRQSSSSSHWRLGVDIAYAAGVSDEQVEAILEVASLPKSADSARERIGGLPLIHETESSLNEVVAAPSMMGVDNVQNDEKNFLGDFTVGSGVPAKKPKRGERKMEVAQ